MLLPNRRQTIIWSNDGIAYWCIYASLSLSELIGVHDEVALVLQ